MFIEHIDTDNNVAINLLFIYKSLPLLTFYNQCAICQFVNMCDMCIGSTNTMIKSAPEEIVTCSPIRL